MLAARSEQTLLQYFRFELAGLNSVWQWAQGISMRVLVQRLEQNTRLRDGFVSKTLPHPRQVTGSRRLRSSLRLDFCGLGLPTFDET
jgi:hypothetical protein